MLPSLGKICELIIAESFKHLKMRAEKQAGVRARKSREREISIESTRREGAKIMNKAHLPASSFVFFG